MSKNCDLLADKGIMVGHKVSHSNRKTKKRFLPNLIEVALKSDILNRVIRMRIANRTMRTIEFKGGFDSFLIKAKNGKLTCFAKSIKKEIKKLQYPDQNVNPKQAKS